MLEYVDAGDLGQRSRCEWDALTSPDNKPRNSKGGTLCNNPPVHIATHSLSSRALARPDEPTKPTPDISNAVGRTRVKKGQHVAKARAILLDGPPDKGTIFGGEDGVETWNVIAGKERGSYVGAPDVGVREQFSVNERFPCRTRIAGVLDDRGGHLGAQRDEGPWMSVGRLRRLPYIRSRHTDERSRRRV